MDWRTAGAGTVVAIRFVVDGEFIIPDASSLMLTIRDNAGAIISGYNGVGLSNATTPNYTIPVLAAVNDIDPAVTFETRYVSVAFTYQGLPYTIKHTYRLTPFLPIQKVAEDVRQLIGATYTELPDEAIDLVEAYFKLVTDVGTNFTTALVRSDRAVICANNMIALQAALTTLPGLQSRLMLTETSHNEIYKRHTIDFAVLEENLEQALAAELLAMTGIVMSTVPSSTVPTIFATSNPVDVITGVAAV